jgi:hypothetical protein
MQSEKFKKIAEQFGQFSAAYPATRRKGGADARRAFAHAVCQVPYAVMLHALEQHKRSEQWQNPRYIPSMLTWLRDEMWIQTLPEPQPARLSVADEARRLASLSPQDQLRRLGIKR